MENTEDNTNLKKIEKKCHIYHNHIRCEKNLNTYISSITHDNGTMYLKSALENKKNLSWKEKNNIYNKISNEMKENEFANLNILSSHGNSIMKARLFVKNISSINEIVFYYPYPIWPWGHYILYGYQYFYYYNYLKKKYPNIKIIMNDPLRNFLKYGTSNNKYWFFLKKTLGLDNIIYTSPERLIINSGITFCVYSQMASPLKMTNKCIEFYNNIAKLSLAKNVININLKCYPKNFYF